MSANFDDSISLTATEMPEGYESPLQGVDPLPGFVFQQATGALAYAFACLPKAATPNGVATNVSFGPEEEVFTVSVHRAEAKNFAQLWLDKSEEVKQLKRELAKLRQERSVDRQRFSLTMEQLCQLYRCAAADAHEHTVEGTFTPYTHAEWEEHHDDVIDWLNDNWLEEAPHA